MRIDYEQLQAAYEKSRQSFTEYERDCREFIEKFRTQLAEYLGCESNKIRILQFPEEREKRPFLNKEEVEVSLGRQMVLYKDASYGFVLRIVLNPPQTMPEQGVDLLFEVRKKDKEYVIKHGGKQTTIPENKPERLNEFVEYMAQETKQFLEGEFENFFHGKKELGFSIA
jgi:hypothetical protein